MPKKISYPPRGMDIKEAIELAKILYNNGKKLKVGTYADLLNMAETGGAFRTKVNTLIKYGLIEKKNDYILTTDLLKKIINAYTENERKELIFKAISNMPLYKKLLDVYSETGLDIKNLDKILIREFEVNERSAKLVKKSIEKSFNYIGVLNKTTGVLNINFTEDMSTEVIERESKAQKLEDIEEKKLPSKPIMKLPFNNEIIDLIISFACHLDAMDISIEEISNIIDHIGNLTHTKVAFDLLKEKIMDGSITQNDLRIILNAIKQDLKMNF